MKAKASLVIDIQNVSITRSKEEKDKHEEEE